VAGNTREDSKVHPRTRGGGGRGRGRGESLNALQVRGGGHILDKDDDPLFCSEAGDSSPTHYLRRRGEEEEERESHFALRWMKERRNLLCWGGERRGQRSRDLASHERLIAAPHGREGRHTRKERKGKESLREEKKGGALNRRKVPTFSSGDR